jgi:membrane protease YdiL (CAAX protease family)
MSIPLVAAAAASAPAAPNASTEMPIAVLLVILIWLIVALVLIQRLGVWRRSTVVGPERLGAEESAWLPLGILLFCFAATVFIAAFIDGLLHTSPRVKPLFLTAIIEGLGFPLVVAVSMALRGDALGRLGLRGKQILSGVALGTMTLFILFPLVFTAEAATEGFIKWTSLPQPQPHPVLQDLTASHDPRLIALAIFVAVIVAPFFEELAFRGFLQTILARCFTWLMEFRSNVNEAPQLTAKPSPPAGPGARWAAILLTAAAFAAVHGEPAFLPPLFVLAVGLGYAYERTGNLWITITTHALFNACQIVFYLAMVAR